VRQALPESENLAELLGGRRGAVDATLPGVGYVIGWVAAERFAPGSPSIAVGCAAALAVGVVVSIVRLRRGSAPRAVVLGLAGVAVAAVIALHTGRAVDFFLVQVLSNAASALAWAASIAVRWPFLGVIVGLVLGQRTRWRRDPVLRAYMRASWVWVAQYLVRLAVFVPLYLADQVVALGAARVLLSWPLVASCLAASWWVLRRSLPPDHPGLRHPSG
jgi:xanthosine utilization system XapX-like protein